MNLFDSHTHYNDEKFIDDQNIILNELKSHNVSNVICCGCNLETSKSAIELSNKYDFIYSSCGIHPSDVPETDRDLDSLINEISVLAKNKKNIAIGEIGLDYYWTTDNKDMQELAFIKQINLANTLDLPIIIHSRDAVNDTMQILKDNPVNKNRCITLCNS